jgi:hypothetical protein
MPFGQPLAFTPENLRKILKWRPHWGNMVLLAIEDERNFTKG